MNISIKQNKVEELLEGLFFLYKIDFINFNKKIVIGINIDRPPQISSWLHYFFIFLITEFPAFKNELNLKYDVINDSSNLDSFVSYLSKIPSDLNYTFSISQHLDNISENVKSINNLINSFNDTQNSVFFDGTVNQNFSVDFSSVDLNDIFTIKSCSKSIVLFLKSFNSIKNLFLADELDKYLKVRFIDWVFEKNLNFNSTEKTYFKLKDLKSRI